MEIRKTGIILLCAVSAAVLYIAVHYVDPLGVQDEDSTNDYRLLSVFWHRQSAEYRALAYQAFNTAHNILNEQGKAHTRDAIIVDIDDTIISTSGYQEQLVKEGREFPHAWLDWMKENRSEPVPGAKHFLTYAASRGYAVFYISNRNRDELDQTLADIQRHGFPLKSRSHVLLQNNNEGKQGRRDSILQKYDVKLLLGDNIEDFSDIFENKKNYQRRQLVDSMRKEFGSRFIIIPNAMYGSWLFQVFHGRNKLTAGDKARILLRAMDRKN